MRHNHSIITRTAMVLFLTLFTAATAGAETVQTYYIDADGTRHDVTATVLTGTESPSNYGTIDLAAGWYVVKSDISYTNQISYKSPTSGTINIILADGAEMTVNVSGKSAISLYSSYPLAIYGQSVGTGRLTVNCDRLAINPMGGLTINGGIVSATCTGNRIGAINAEGAAITINGGQVTATPGNNAIGIITDGGIITLGGSTVTSYGGYYGTVTVALPDGYAYTDGNGNTYANGTLTSEQKTAIAGKTLTVAPDPAHFSVNAAGTEYTIHTAAGWGVFCDLLANNAKGIFDGKTVKLGADITVTRMAGGSQHDFTGTFDGDGHTLTLSLGTAESPIDAQYVAPFPNTTDNGNSHPTFRNLTIDGSIYEAYSGTEDHHHVGGLIGHLWGTVTIEHCTSRVNITSTSGAGGFVGLCESAVSFTDCVSSAVIHSAGGNNSGFVGWSRSSSYVIDFKGCLFNGKLLQNGGSGSMNGGFVGWKGDNKTVNITNCLVAPAALADGETMADEGSATFSREHAEYAATITNSYYTRTLGTAQGKAPRTVTAGDNVTVAVSPVGQPVANGTYSVSGITAYTEGITRTVGGATTFYYGQNDKVSLTLSNTPPSTLHTFSGAYTATGGTLSGTENPYTLTMPDQDVTIGAEWTLQSVTYLDADGKEKQCTSYTVLTGGGATSLTAGWYVATGTVNYTGTVTLGGDIHLILADNCQMNCGTSSNRIQGKGIFGYNPLTIYGQTSGDGTLSIYTNRPNVGAIYATTITINGGHVIADMTGGSDSATIYCGGSVTINGGTVEVIASGNRDTKAIYASENFNYAGGTVTTTATGKAISAGNYNFTWRNQSDCITIGSQGLDDRYGYSKATFSRLFTDGNGNYFSGGPLTGSALNDLAGKTLRPVKTADLAQATIFGEEKYVTTFYHGTLNYQLPEGAKAYTASLDGTKVVFHLIGDDGRVIPQGTAAIVVADVASIVVADEASITFTPLSSTTVTPHAGNILQGSDVAIDKPSSGTVYVLNIENKTLGFYPFKGDKIPAGKAYYYVAQ